jgi:hypothetical protein
MKFQKTVAMAAVMVFPAVVTGREHAQSQKAAKQTVAVCLNTSGEDAEILQARASATKIFAEIGVRIAWFESEGTCTAISGGIVIALSRNTPENQHSGAFAYAMPFEGTHIVVFHDRVSRQVNSKMAPLVLAYVFVHEITHILQGTDDHAAKGIMKARWDYLDFADMQKGTLGFTKVDLALIRRGYAMTATPRLTSAKN